MVPTDNVHLGLRIEHTHLQYVLGDIVDTLYMARMLIVEAIPLHRIFPLTQAVEPLCVLPLSSFQTGLPSVADPGGLANGHSRGITFLGPVLCISGMALCLPLASCPSRPTLWIMRVLMPG